MTKYFQKKRLLNDDISNIFNHIQQNSVDMVILDPPYGIGNKKLSHKGKKWKKSDEDWDQFESVEDQYQSYLKWLTLIKDSMKDTGNLFLCASFHNLYLCGEILQRQLGMKIVNSIVWNKCLSSSTKVYAQTPNREGPQTVGNLSRLNPTSVKLWNGKKWTKVIAWKKVKVESSISIELRSGERIECSAEHRWPTQRGLINTRDLVEGDILQSCTLPEPIKAKKSDLLPENLVGWFIGLYLAEGSRGGRDKKCIQITGNLSEDSFRLEKLHPLVNSYEGSISVHNTQGLTSNIHIHGKIIEGLIEHYIHEGSAKTKHLKTSCWQKSNEFLKAILEGYLHGDGHWEEKDSRWRLNFARNEQLLSNLRTICARLNYSISVRPSKSFFNEKSYLSYFGEIRTTKTTYPNSKSRNEIVKIRKGTSRYLIDVAVEDDPHLFALSSGILTHNCNAMFNVTCSSLIESTEHLIWAAKTDEFYFDYEASKTFANGKQLRNVWTSSMTPTSERVGHPHQKPIWLVQRCLEIGCPKEGFVLDPMCGSGTTAVACEGLELDYLCVEKNQEYFEQAKERLDGCRNIFKE